MARRNDKKSYVIPNPLKILYVEDSPADAELCLHDLKKAGFMPNADVVASPAEFHQNLKTKPYDVILSDSSMPEFSAMEALEIAQTEAPEIPFILVTGTIGDESAVECIKKGATDYVLKDRRARLAASVRRALEEKRLREERQHAMDEVLVSQRRLENIFKASRMGLWDWDLRTDEVYFSSRWKNQLGYEDYEISDRLQEWHSRIHPDDFEGWQATVRQCMARPSAKFEGEYRMRHRDASYRWMLTRATVIRDTSGKPVRLVGSNEDITERKRAVEALNQERARLFSVLETMPAAICLLTADYHVPFANRSFRELFGDPRGRHCYESVFGLTAPCEFCQSFEPLKTGQPHRWEVTTPAGKVVDVHDFPFTDADGTRMVLEMDIDITDRKKAEADLRAARDQWALTFDTVPDPILVMDKDCRITRVNRAAAALAGLEPDQVVGKHCYEIVHGQAEPRPDCPHQQLLQSGAAGEGDIYEPWLDKYFTSAVIPLPGPEDGRGGCVHVLHDVTARRHAEDDLRHSEALFKVFMDHGPALAWMKDRDGRYVFCNTPFLRALNVTQEEIIGKTDSELWEPETAQGYRENDLKVLSAGMPMEFMEAIPGSDKERELWVFKFPFHDPLGRQLVGAKAIEITERKRLEEQLRQAQKMEAIGQLAGGVAHDFNNLLTIISGYSELLAEELCADARLGGHVKQIQSAASRASALTKQLLAFARRQTVAVETMDVNSVVARAELMLRPLIGEDIELITRPAPDLRHVKADPGQIEQVIMNLVVNARDAMPRGGKLIVETANVDVPVGGPLSSRGLRPGRYSSLRVIDSGSGIDPKIKDHIFEPFFTTKEKGKGTGLGLATVYGIANQCGGQVIVDSELGQGSTFQVFLPSVQEAVSTLPNEASTVAHRPCTETILVVEDEESLRTMVRGILEACGYKVLEAAQGVDALALCQQCAAPIHLLLTDVVMPQMGGPELAARLKTFQAQIRVMYMSGYTDGRITFDSTEADHALITKPFTPKRLMDKVRDVLDSPLPVARAV